MASSAWPSNHRKGVIFCMKISFWLDCCDYSSPWLKYSLARAKPATFRSGINGLHVHDGGPTTKTTSGSVFTSQMAGLRVCSVPFPDIKREVPEYVPLHNQRDSAHP